MRRGSGLYRDASAAPPDSDASTISTGASDGFTNGALSAWDVIAGQGTLLSDLRSFLEDVAEQPQLRSCATLRALDRIRDALEKVPETSAADASVELMLQDVALLATQVLQRLR